jgi:hypothetical protein
MNTASIHFAAAKTSLSINTLISNKKQTPQLSIYVQQTYPPSAFAICQ